MEQCCKCCPDSFKAEFQTRNFGLYIEDPSAFYCCQVKAKKQIEKRMNFTRWFVANLHFYVSDWLQLIQFPRSSRLDSVETLFSLTTRKGDPLRYLYRSTIDE